MEWPETIDWGFGHTGADQQQPVAIMRLLLFLIIKIIILYFR